MKWLKRFSTYQLGIFLSASSMAFGLLREFMIIGLLGFSVKNDLLQVYLSIFYTIGLMIDAMRLSCLNLFSLLSLLQIIISASLVSFPFVILIGLVMNYFTGGLDYLLLSITIVGSFLNLIAALLITYKQRNNVFLGAQIINVLPNFILIPGIILCYFFGKKNMIFSIVTLTSLIPVAQCILLLCLPEPIQENKKTKTGNFIDTILIFYRHFFSMIGEQLFQIITRSAFYQFGTGYLSLLTLSVRIYSAFRFILIDSYIGSKLFSWNKLSNPENDYLLKLIQSNLLNCFIAVIAFLVSIKNVNQLTHACIQIISLLLIGFYFSTLVRIVYFKINRYENNPQLVLRFGFYELLFAGFAYSITQFAPHSIFILLWIGLIAKPLTQLLLLRKRFVSIPLTPTSVSA